MREGGTNWNQVIGTMMWGVRILVLYIDCLKRKVSSKAIPKEIGVHPFVIMKHSKHYEILLQKEQQMSFALQQLLDLDFHIKSGKLPSSVFWLQLKKIILTLH